MKKFALILEILQIKKSLSFEYTDSAYDAELARIRERFIPLVKICKEYGTAMRIGTNHGSLSDRIMSRYGDTALGMVESALEFLRICEEENYYNIVLSMKSSNTQVMVEAYRLLIVKMDAEQMNYPLHLGVTEAGEGEDGRIKSAVGIGTLLEDGIGDTVRVSLTEDPEFEIPVAKALVDRYTNRLEHAPIVDLSFEVKKNKSGLPYNPFEYSRRVSSAVKNVGGENVPRIIADFSKHDKITAANLFGVGYNYSVPLDKWNLTDQACDFIYLGKNKIDFAIPGTLSMIVDAANWRATDDYENTYPYFSSNEFISAKIKSTHLNFIGLTQKDIFENADVILKSIDKTCVLVLETKNTHAMAELRRIAIELMNRNVSNPFIVKRSYNSISSDELQLHASTDFGALLLDGFPDAIWIDAHTIASPQMINSLGFGILQAARTRISKTEYISCPSCGRTLFDLQETTAKIRSRTDHLKGIKIGIMGCIVNGPGEMADADYGYVGSGPGKITLYKGKVVVERSIEAEKAVDALINLIKEHGDWVEKELKFN